MEAGLNKDLPLIGVIGGVGPYAGLDFVRNIFSNTIAVKDQEHLNCMLISCSSIIPDRTGFLLSDGTQENPALGMFECARRLNMAGVRYAVVACNTAHSNKIFSPFVSMVKEHLPGIKIINMLETCMIHVKESLRIKKIGLLATIGTYKSRVYHEYFKTEEGFNLIEPDTPGQENIHQAIYDEQFGIKSHSQPVTSKAVEMICDEINKLVNCGAKAIILGCTELPLAMKGINLPVPVIDPGLITARALIKLVNPEKLAALNI